MNLTKEDLLKWESRLCGMTHMSIDEMEAAEAAGDLSIREWDLLMTIRVIHNLYEQV